MTSAEPLSGISLDLGNLVAFDGRAEHNKSAEEMAREATDAIVHAVFSLPMTELDDGRYVNLPKGTFALPREKPIPKERAPTKWEKYALEKGIQKRRKRDRLIFDEETGEYVPRYGRGSKNSNDRHVIIPHKEGMGSDYDPFAAKREEKRDRIKQNRKKNLSNIGRARKAAGLQPMQALDVAKVGPSGKKYLPKKDLSDTLSVVQRSTASAGRFDNQVRGERKPKMRGRKKKLESFGGKNAAQQEKERLGKIADRILKT